MTADLELPPITCPSSLVASCGPLLGFEPSECVVGVVHDVPGRLGPVLVRLDLGEPREAGQRAHDVLAGILGTGGAAVALVAFVEDGDESRATDLRSSSVMDQLCARAERRGIDVVACISTNGRVWWDHECPDPECCSQARPLDGSIMTRVRAEYAYAGYAPLASRDAVRDRVAPDAGARARAARALGGLRPPARLERWRDAQVESLVRLLVPRPTLGEGTTGGSGAGQPLAPVRVARAVRALADVPVRDSVLVRLMGTPRADQTEWRRTLDTLCGLVRAAPAGSVAPVAAVTAIVAWLRGDGALANAALDRADDDDPGYRLAGLVREVMGSGVDPQVWRAAMGTLTEADCRAAGRGIGR